MLLIVGCRCELMWERMRHLAAKVKGRRACRHRRGHDRRRRRVVARQRHTEARRRLEGSAARAWITSDIGSKGRDLGKGTKP